MSASRTSGEGAGLRNSAHGHGDRAKRVDSEVAGGGLGGAMRKRIEGGDEVDEATPTPRGEGPAPSWPPVEGPIVNTR
jgi:hypothetical protein